MRRNCRAIEPYSNKGFCFIPLQGVGIAVISSRVVRSGMTARDGVPKTTAFKIDFFDGDDVDNVIAWERLSVDIEQ